MEAHIYHPIRRSFILLTFALASVAVSFPNVFGVVPAPDGGYPGSNTAEGQSALLSLTSGTLNTAVGASSLGSVTDGSANTGVGGAALYFNTADENTAVGAGALFFNTTGSANTANGAFALFSNTTGAGNTAIGDRALLSNTVGDQITAIGHNALGSLRSGFNTTAVGADAMSNSIHSDGNTAIGVAALRDTSTSGNFGINNTAVGEGTLINNTSGSGNIALGSLAGYNITDAANVICIGAAGENESNTCYIGNIYAQVSSRGTAVFVNSDGKLGTFSSSRRFKEGIKPMERASEALFALKPVTFRYKKEIDPVGTSQFGLVAEDVEAVNPDLVVRDKEGKVNTVRYEAVNAMLLNEFLKAHRKMEQQQKQIDGLTAQLKEQAAQIQKVSTHIEASKPEERVVLNSQ